MMSQNSSMVAMGLTMARMEMPTRMAKENSQGRPCSTFRLMIQLAKKSVTFSVCMAYRMIMTMMMPHTRVEPRAELTTEAMFPAARPMPRMAQTAVQSTSTVDMPYTMPTRMPMIFMPYGVMGAMGGIRPTNIISATVITQ